MVVISKGNVYCNPSAGFLSSDVQKNNRVSYEVAKKMLEMIIIHKTEVIYIFSNFESLNLTICRSLVLLFFS